MIGGQLWSPLFLQHLLPNYLVFEHFLLFSNNAPLSGWVSGTRCQISVGARGTRSNEIPDVYGILRADDSFSSVLNG